MKKQFKLVAFICLFLLLLTSLRLLWMTNVSSQVTVGDSGAGFMDLSTVSPEEKTLYPLTGEWLFYSEELLTTEEIKNSNFQEQIKTYPQGWLEESATKEYNYGTFYMQLTVPDELLQTSLSMHVPNTRLASRLYVNGEKIGSSGRPASNYAQFAGSMSPYVAHFFTDKNVIDVVLHVSNDGTSPPVPSTPIAFGTTDSILANQTLSLVSKLIVVTVFSFMLLFAVFLYFYVQTKQKKTMVYLALFLIFGILTASLDFDQIILLDLPITYDLKSKIFRLAYVLNALFAFQFFKHFLSEYRMPTLYNYYPHMNLAYVAFILLAPLKVIDTYGAFILLIFLVPFIYFIMKLFYAIRTKADDAELLLLMGLSMLNNFLWSVYKTYTGTLTFEYYPIDVLIALSVFILYWLRKYLRHTEKIETLTEELLVKDKDKDEFLAQTSHELRNPLHSMINIAKLVAENPNNTIVKEDEASMGLLLSVGKRMSLLVDDLLDLSLLSEKRLRLNKSPIYMQTIVSTVIEMVEYLIRTKKITLQSKISGDFPAVYADENRVIQLTLNLLHNAIKYTDEGEITITAKVVADEAVISVSDTGRGMDADHVTEVFEPFFKSDDEDGIGLGLQVTKELVELHGGNITIESELQRGTTVTFTLPLAKGMPAKVEPFITPTTVTEGFFTEQIAAAVAGGSGLESAELGRVEEGKATEQHTASSVAVVAPPMRTEEEKPIAPDPVSKNDVQLARAKVLVVDDDHVNVEVMAKLLQASQYKVVTALSGKEALQYIQAESFDLVISDVMMPHMSGYELVKNLRKQYDLSELPIILLTARGKIDDLNAGFQAGANDYLVKPVDAAELNARAKALTDLQIAVKDQLRLEAAWLRAQINPHFLYNTINSIMMMARANPDRMQYLLEKFVYFLRASYDFQCKQSLISLKDELKLVDAYLSIEKERFGERLQIIWGIDESLDVSIPPLSLQTLVENALKHGILNRVEGGTVTLQSIEEADYVDVIVQDDGAGMSEELIAKVHHHEFVEGDGIGLINTDKRLRRWLQTPLIIDSKPNEGTKITIRIRRQT